MSQLNQVVSKYLQRNKKLKKLITMPLMTRRSAKKHLPQTSVVDKERKKCHIARQTLSSLKRYRGSRYCQNIG